MCCAPLGREGMEAAPRTAVRHRHAVPLCQLHQRLRVKPPRVSPLSQETVQRTAAGEIREQRRHQRLCSGSCIRQYSFASALSPCSVTVISSKPRPPAIQCAAEIHHRGVDHRRRGQAHALIPKLQRRGRHSSAPPLSPMRKMGMSGFFTMTAR